MWVEKPIEKITHEQLIHKLGNGAGEDQYGLYTTARKHLVEDILPQIQTVIPSITDHGPEHVADVLDRAGQLLEIETHPTKLEPMELYEVLPIVKTENGLV